MKNKFSLSVISALAVLSIMAASCAPVPAVAAHEPLEDSAASLAPTAVMPPAPTAMPAAPTAVIPVTGAAIKHTLLPAGPSGKPQVIYDQTSDKTAAEKRAYGGDDFSHNRYERPFTQAMDYLPYLDIAETHLFRQKDSPWVYVSIRMVKMPEAGATLAPLYGVELDTALAGRGRYLILASPPAGTTWTTDGVQVQQDVDGDVGSAQPILPDTQSASDGYEAQPFDQGKGDDADLAWVRISPQSPDTIELAFKNTLIGGEKGKFLWGAWSMTTALDPSKFDLNDHFTLESAGSPLKELAAFYPLKALFAVDNTCRAASGFTPSGGERGICPNSAPPKPDRPDKVEPGKPGPNTIPVPG